MSANRKHWPNDAKRPLTAAGKQRFRKAARGLVKWLPKSAALLTSPYVRARETAVILAAARRGAKPVECVELAADRPVSAAFELLRTRKEKAVVLVGHEPYLSGFLSAALAGGRTRGSRSNSRKAARPASSSLRASKPGAQRFAGCSRRACCARCVSQTRPLRPRHDDKAAPNYCNLAIPI